MKYRKLSSVTCLLTLSLLLLGCESSSGSKDSGSEGGGQTSINNPTDLSSLGFWFSADSNVLDASGAPAANSQVIEKWIGRGPNNTTIEVN